MTLENLKKVQINTNYIIKEKNCKCNKKVTNEYYINLRNDLIFCENCKQTESIYVNLKNFDLNQNMVNYKKPEKITFDYNFISKITKKNIQQIFDLTKKVYWRSVQLKNINTPSNYSTKILSINEIFNSNFSIRDWICIDTNENDDMIYLLFNINEKSIYFEKLALFILNENKNSGIEILDISKDNFEQIQKEYFEFNNIQINFENYPFLWWLALKKYNMRVVF